MIILNNNGEDIMSVDYKLRDMSHISYIMFSRFNTGIPNMYNMNSNVCWAWDEIGVEIYYKTTKYIYDKIK